MALSILQNISDTIVARLKNITDANSYEFEVGTVALVNRDKNTWNPSPRDILIEQRDSTLVEDLTIPGNPAGITYETEFAIHGFSSQLDMDSTEPGVVDTGTTDNHMLAAIMKAIVNSDATGWQTFGSNAITAWFPSYGPFDGAGHDGGMVVLSVMHRVDETDPYTKR